MYSTTSISPLDLHLDEKNPRFRVNVNPSQDDIRKYMIRHEKLLILANSMVSMNTLLPGERIIIYKNEEQNIVLEGNRRSSVYQMLLNRELIPNEFKTVFPVAKEEFLSEITSIPVDVVNSREESMAFLAARHIIGVEKWSSVSKWKISYEYYKDGSSINQISTRLVMSANKVRTSIKNYKVLLRGVNNPIWTDEEKIHLSPLDIKPDKLIRIIGLNETVERFGLYYSENFDLLSNKFSDNLITSLIVLLTKMAFITNEINTRTTINKVWEKIVAVIPEFMLSDINTDGTERNDEVGTTDHNTNTNESSTPSSITSNSQPDEEVPAGNGGRTNIPYFFDGLQFGHIDPTDLNTHGVSRVCFEIKRFSERKLVNTFPIAAAFLTRALIEQSITFYAKTHNIQAQTITIWSRICNGNTDPKLSYIIGSFNRCLTDYINDPNIRDYFTLLFSDYNITANPLNWVIHRPYEFVMSPTKLIELPANGLLQIINYFLS